jgi:hypothetical protein
MALTLEQLRTALAWSVSRMFAGTATGGSTTTLVDINGLPRFTETDALKGARLYIHTTTDGLAPQGESRRVQGFNEATQTITVDRAFSAAPGSGDTYEIYLGPLTMDQWDGCINDAIRNAWPELFTPAIEEVTPTGALEYALSSNTDQVLGAEITFKTGLVGYASQELLQWYSVGLAGGLTLVLGRPVPSSSNMTIRLLVGLRFDELTAGQSTYLDPQYILDAARARFYQRMADASRQSDRGSFLQLMAHWTEKAEERLQRLSSILWGETPEEKED